MSFWSSLIDVFRPKPKPVPPVFHPLEPAKTFRAVAFILPGHPNAKVKIRLPLDGSYPSGDTFEGLTNGDGYFLATPVLDGSNLQAGLYATVPGFDPYEVAVAVPSGNQNLIAGQNVPALVPSSGPGPSPTPGTWTKKQLLDMQGDLMVWMPELGSPAYTGIVTKGDNGATAHGLVNGWIWTLFVQWYSPADRQRIYAKYKSYGWTHFCIQVCEQAVNGGYHGTRPISQADRDGYGALMNVVHAEILAAGLIPVCAGVAPGPAVSGGAELAAGFDASKVLLAMTDWDNTTWAAERIKKISDTFPNAWLFYERPGDKTRGSGIDKSPNDPVDAGWPIGDGNGGQWIANMQRLCPRFVGVLYEVNNWPGGDSVDVCAAEIQQANDKFWRDVLGYRFETNTYEKYWGGETPDVFDALEAQLASRVSFLGGYCSGGASHPVIPDTGGGNTDIPSGGKDMIDPKSISWVAGVDIGSFALTDTLKSVGVLSDDVYVDWTGKDTWPSAITPGWSGALQYSMGICFNINGQWYGSAPIESWQGKNHTGGPIQQTNVEGSGKGQLPKNWFYNSSWGAMAGYQPQPGEQVGFFLACGDCRNNFNPTKIRTNIVMFPMPANNEQHTFTF